MACIVSDLHDLELFTPLQPIFLSSTSKMSDFHEVSLIVSSREESMRAWNINLESKWLTIEAQISSLKARCSEMEGKFERGYDGFRTKIDDLELMVSEEKVRWVLLEGRCGEFDIDLFEARAEVERYRMENQRIKRKMREEALVMRMKEQKTASFLKEIKRMEKELEESFVGLKGENRNLGRAKKQAQDESDAWMRMENGESDDRSMSRANDECRNPCHQQNLHIIISASSSIPAPDPR